MCYAVGHEQQASIDNTSQKFNSIYVLKSDTKTFTLSFILQPACLKFV